MTPDPLVDFQVKRLVENLRDLGHWQKCVFALTADHVKNFSIMVVASTRRSAFSKKSFTFRSC
jgi:hypothetical protein